LIVTPSLPTPIRVDVLIERAQAAYNAGHRDEARRISERVLRSDPLNAEALNLIGVVLANDARIPEAIPYFENAIRIDPGHFDAHCNLGFAISAIGLFPEALRHFDLALAIRPRDEKALMLRAIALSRLGRFSDALEAYDELMRLSQVDAILATNRAITLTWAGRPEEAMASFNIAVQLNPDDANAWWCKALQHLLLGDLSVGFQLYEWRWKNAVHPIRRKLATPEWLGETSIAGKTIYIDYEQGFGDTIQFCRYISLVAQAGATVILEVQKPLKRLMRTLAGPSLVISEGDELPNHDIQTALLSLPLAFRTTLETIPARVPYLNADPEQSANWRQRIAHLPGRRIGLVWAGARRIGHASAVAGDQRRSTTLEALAPLAAIPDCSFVSLQLGPPAEELKWIPEGFIVHDCTSELNDFADTAALIDNLDLVISVDTSVVHLAGAMAKPVWLLNRFDSCWRWLLNRDDSPWYPTVRQFRQTSAGDWDSVIARVSTALTAREDQRTR
jgi:tetratricopeptide (TPR) repeat protein